PRQLFASHGAQSESRGLTARPYCPIIRQLRRRAGARSERTEVMMTTASAPAPRPLVSLFSLEESGFRFAAFAGELLRSKHRGWCSDEDRGTVLRPLIVRMSSGRGKARFVAGYQISDSEAIVLDLGRTFQGPQLGELGVCEAAAEAAAY